jgi:hypothetical protein
MIAWCWVVNHVVVVVEVVVKGETGGAVGWGSFVVVVKRFVPPGRRARSFLLVHLGM